MYYDELARTIEEHEGKNFLMADGYMLYDDTKIMIDTGDKLSDDITLKDVVILITAVIKDDAKVYPQIFLEKALFVK